MVAVLWTRIEHSRRAAFPVDRIGVRDDALLTSIVSGLPIGQLPAALARGFG